MASVLEVETSLDDNTPSMISGRTASVYLRGITIYDEKFLVSLSHAQKEQRAL
jgi:hypothetical protein